MLVKLECNIICPGFEKTGGKPRCIREQIVGISVVSEYDFDTLTFVWSCNVYAL